MNLDVHAISKHPLVDAMMKVVGGLFFVLNEDRQIIAMNRAMLDYLGIDDADRILGFKTGDVLGCSHTQDEPAGCGSSQTCGSCGIATAMAQTLDHNEASEQRAALAVSRSGVMQDLVFQIRAVPMVVGDERLVLMFLQDITQRQNWAALESTFFHDIGNMLTNLLFVSESLSSLPIPEHQELIDRLADVSHRIVSEFSIQRALVQTGAPHYQTKRVAIPASKVLEELAGFLRTSPYAERKNIEMPVLDLDFNFRSDYSLVMRVLINMLTNALEASDDGTTVRVQCMKEDDGVFFSVWNEKEIPLELRGRIFQRNFTTKSSEGHGLGTFSMKLFGEQYLGGRVNFHTSREDGTEFEFWLPEG